MNKYRNIKTEFDGITFDSRKEAARWAELKVMERMELIHDLQRQVPFELIPSQRDGNGKVVERATKYVADFVYITRTGKQVVEDAKSEATRTDVYKIKKKLMRERYGIEIREV